MKYLALIIALMFGNILLAQYAYLVKDVSQMTRGSYCNDFTKVGNTTFFTATDYYHGYELWKTDGTAEGTSLVKDIVEGTGSGMDYNTMLVNYNNYLYFLSGTYDGTISLWKSDGSEAGTVLVKTISAGNELNSEFYIVNGKLLFFVLDNDNYTLHLWKSDGTSSGTVILASYDEYPSYNSYITVVNNVLYYRPDFGTLCKTDGTAAGTVTVKTGLSTAGVTPNGKMVSLNGILFFIGYSSSTGYELFKSDGTTAGTVVVKDINPGSADGNITSLSAVGNYLYFSANDGVSGGEPWRSNGTGSGTTMIKDVNPIGNSSAQSFYQFDNEIYFAAYNGVTYALFRTNGTSSGTFEIHPLEYFLKDYSDSFYEFDNKLYFIDYYNNMYVTDGTYAGTNLITESEVYDISIRDYGMFVVRKVSSYVIELSKFLPESNSLQPIFTGRYYANGIDLDDKFIFLSELPDYKYEPFISNGTMAGTSLLKDVNAFDDSEIATLTAINDELVFTANANSNYLWKSNGHSSGTVLVTDSVTSPVAYNDNLLFIKNYKLWMSDLEGNEPTLLLNNISTISYSKIIDDTLFFQYRNKIYRLSPFSNSLDTVFTGIFSNMYLNDFEKLNSYLFVSAQTEGVVRVNLNDLSTTTLFDNSYSNSKFFKCGDSLYFPATVVTYDTLWFDETYYHVFENYDARLYKTAGEELISLAPMSVDKGLVVGNKLFLKGYYEGQNGLFCVDDNTNSVTFLLPYYDNILSLTELNNQLVFVYADINNDVELWKSDGTVEGTMIVRDINTSGSSFPTNLVVKDNILYFSADDGINGRELWSSDGTEDATIMIADINPDFDSNPDKLVVSGNNIFFVADNGQIGRELWAYGLTTSENCFAFFYTDYDSVTNTFILSIDSVTLANASNFFWDFGDGYTSNEENPIHEFASNDIFKVCMTAYTSSDESCEFCHDIGKDVAGNIYKTDGFNLNVESPTEVENLINYLNEIRIFPNPCKEYFTITSENVDEDIILNIVDMSGRVLIEEYFSTEFIVDVGSLLPGIYIVNCFVESSFTYSKKIVVE
ncbi:MAG: T9SS type A sorting domain-containing protein [Bacteroidales bacterium]|nr:T9SS type A sorting domain-containing protein [Bacteroidales bacterium]